jgi:hypothetical protein
MKGWLLLLVLSLSACSDYNGNKALNNYQQRMARVLDTDVPDTNLPLAATLIPERDLKQPLPDIRLDLSDAYATRQCNLDTLIGERNSSLGKVYSASKQLSYELRFLNQLEICLQKSWGDTELVEQLQLVYQQKQHSIQLAFNNMLLSDDTLRKELLGVPNSLPLNDVAGFNETWQALTELTLLQQFIAQKNWQAASKVDIEQQLQRLYQYNFVARLQYSLRLSSHKLAQLNTMVQSQNRNTLCPSGRDSEQLQILANVFSKYFATEIQRYTSALSQYQQQLWPLLDELYQHTPLGEALTLRFDQSYQTMRAELKTHVSWWQTLNSECPLQLTAKR